MLDELSLLDSLNLYSNENRHLNGHRLKYNLKTGYIAFTELILYGGQNRNLDIALLNPLLPYYIYHRNNKGFTSNSILSLEIYKEFNTYSFFVEMILDDFQVEKKSSRDLEPSEYAILLELKKTYDKSFVRYNILKVANRTFNAPNFNYEKYINKNQPMGHPLGNNFWSTNLEFCFNNSKSYFSFIYTYVNKGEEALFSSFNEDFFF